MNHQMQGSSIYIQIVYTYRQIDRLLGIAWNCLQGPKNEQIPNRFLELWSQHWDNYEKRQQIQDGSLDWQRKVCTQFVNSDQLSTSCQVPNQFGELTPNCNRKKRSRIILESSLRHQPNSQLMNNPFEQVLTVCSTLYMCTWLRNL